MPIMITQILGALMSIIGAIVLLFLLLFGLLLALETLIPEKMLVFYLKHHNNLLSQRREPKMPPTAPQKPEASEAQEAKEEETNHKKGYEVSQASTSTDYSDATESNVGGRTQKQVIPPKEIASDTPVARPDREDGFAVNIPSRMREKAIDDTRWAKFESLSKRQSHNQKTQPEDTEPKNTEAPTPTEDEQVTDIEVMDNSDNLSIEQLEGLLNRLGYYGATNDDGFQTGGDLVEAILRGDEISFFTEEERILIRENSDLTVFLNFAMLSQAQLVRSYADNPNIGKELA